VVVLLFAAVGGLGYYILTQDREPTEKIVIKEVPTVKEADGGKPAADEKDEASAKEETKAEEPAAGDGENGEAGAAANDSPGRRGKKRTRRSSGSKRSSGTAPAAGAAPAPASTKKPSGGGGADDLDVDCILDPSKCKTGGSKKKKKSSSGGGGSTDPNAPTQLSTSDVRAGISAVKGSAKSCGSKHGASAGTKVQVKLSIEGATGRVKSAKAMPPHAGTALGNCVAAALKKAKFRTFKKAVMGVIVPIRM